MGHASLPTHRAALGKSYLPVPQSFPVLTRSPLPSLPRVQSRAGLAPLSPRTALWQGLSTEAAITQPRVSSSLCTPGSMYKPDFSISIFKKERKEISQMFLWHLGLGRTDQGSPKSPRLCTCPGPSLLQRRQEAGVNFGRKRSFHSSRPP